MIFLNDITGAISILLRVLAMIIFGSMAVSQFKAVYTVKDVFLRKERRLILIFFIVSFIQNIVPILVIALSIFANQPVNSAVYILNNSFFTLTMAALMLAIWVED